MVYSNWIKTKKDNKDCQSIDNIVSSLLRDIFFTPYVDGVKGELYVTFNERGAEEPSQYFVYSDMPVEAFNALKTENDNPDGSIGSLFHKLIKKNEAIQYFSFPFVKEDEQVRYSQD